MLRSICTRTWSGRPMLRGCRATCTSLASKVSLYCFGGAAVWRENRTIGAAVLSALLSTDSCVLCPSWGHCQFSLPGSSLHYCLEADCLSSTCLACGPVTYNLLKLLKSTRLLKSPGLLKSPELLNSPLHISSM